MKTTVTKEFKWDCAHMLEGHPGLCKNLHGHTYHLQVTAEPLEDRHDMVVDFGDLKKTVQSVIVRNYDHSFIYNEESTDPVERGIAELLQKHGRLTTPLKGRTTAENMARDMLCAINAEASYHMLQWRATKVRLYETETSFAEVSYE